MERSLLLLLPLCLGLLQRGLGGPLEVEPPEPVVAVALGGSLALTCRLECPRGEAPSVQWRGLDTSLGAVRSDARSSVLAVRNASLSAAGTRVCVGSCGPRTFQRAVQLLVYAFPDQLSVSPAALVPGQDQEVVCTAPSVTPVDPNALSFSLLLGERELEGAQALGREEEPLEDEDMLFRVTERWLLPPLGPPAPAALHCQATMKLPGLELHRRQRIPVIHDPAAPEAPATANPEPPSTANPESPTTADPSPPTTANPEPPSTANPELPSTPALGPPTITNPPPPTTATLEAPTTTDPPAPTTAILEAPTTADPPAPTTATLKAPTTADPPAPTMAATAALQQGSTHDPRSAVPEPQPSLASPCRPEIHQAPAPTDRKARLELLCVAACGSGVAVRWTRAPGGLAAYERREAGARAWLTLPQAGQDPEGWFQCRLHPGDQVASLYVVPRSPSGPDDVDVAVLWMGSLVLGLLLLAFLAHRLRRHCRSPG